MIHEVQMGKRTRMSFARIEEALAVPDLIEVQKNSYQHFLDVDLKEVLADVSPITDYNDSLMLEFVDYKLDEEPKNSIERCKERDQTYAAPLKVTVRLTNKETQEVRQSDVFIGDFPLMTEHGTFIINGAERVIVSQLVRSPGVYYERAMDKSGKYTYATKMIPNRGAWLEYECDPNDVLSVRIDRTRKLPMTILLRALGYGSNAEIIDLLGEDEKIRRVAGFGTDCCFKNGLKLPFGDCNITLPYQVPESRVFVMGDNRNNSKDSRFSDVGVIHKDELIGRAWLQIYPFSHFGFVDHGEDQ